MKCEEAGAAGLPHAPHGRGCLLQASPGLPPELKSQILAPCAALGMQYARGLGRKI